jgi:hypothetical protein
VERYNNALELTTSNVLQAKLLCKLAILEGLQKTASREEHKARLEKIQEIVLKNDDKNLSLYLRLTEAMVAKDDNLLRDFIERFELSADPELMTQEALDLRLFALERLITQSIDLEQNTFPKDWRLLDSILSDRYLDKGRCIYLNRFFDLAIRICAPTDYSQLVRYSLLRLGPQATGERWSLPPGSTFVGFYFSFWSDENGFALYYPDDRQKSQRFELPYNRVQIKEAIEKGESLSLDETLVSFIRQDINAGVQIVLVWDDTTCWSDRRDALSDDDWRFGERISLEEMMGIIK